MSQSQKEIGITYLGCNVRVLPVWVPFYKVGVDVIT